MPVLFLLEDGLDAVSLGANAVNLANIHAVSAVNVVTAGEPIAACERCGEQDSVCSVDRHQVFPNDESCGAVVVQVAVKLGQIGHGQSPWCTWIAGRNALCLCWPVRYQFSNR